MTHEKLFKIHIPEPCHEDWNKMIPNDKGALCKVCSKTVVDFSKRTDADIQKFLLENLDKKVCGRFKTAQLDSDGVEVPRLKIEFEAPKFHFPGFLMPVMTDFRAAALALILFASAVAAGCGNSGYGGGEYKQLTGAIEIVDSNSRPINNNIDTNSNNIPVNFDERTMGAVNRKSVKDSTCNVKDADNDENMTIRKIAPVQHTDTIKADTTEKIIQGEIQKKEPEPRTKMGIMQKTETKEQDYKKGDVKIERKDE